LALSAGFELVAFDVSAGFFAGVFDATVFEATDFGAEAVDDSAFTGAGVGCLTDDALDGPAGGSVGRFAPGCCAADALALGAGADAESRFGAGSCPSVCAVVRALMAEAASRALVIGAVSREPCALAPVAIPASRIIVSENERIY
jgi:hypothetical protein